MVAAGVRARIEPGDAPRRVALEVLPWRARAFARRVCWVHRGRVNRDVQVEPTAEGTRLSATISPDRSAASWLFWIAPAWHRARLNGDRRSLGIPIGLIRVVPAGGEGVTASTLAGPFALGLAVALVMKPSGAGHRCRPRRGALQSDHPTNPPAGGPGGPAGSGRCPENTLCDA